MKKKEEREANFNKTKLSYCSTPPPNTPGDTPSRAPENPQLKPLIPDAAKTSTSPNILPNQIIRDQTYSVTKGNTEYL